MFYLRLLGAPNLEGDDVAIDARATQRHRLALLALLALAPGRRLSRDKLIGYLWPDRDADGARNLLKVSTYVLRSVLGDSALLSEGDDLRLSTESLDIDVAAFDAAIERGDHARAAALYKGPFLDGFFLPEAPEFDSWCDRERTRLAGRYRTTLESLAQERETAGDLHGAVERWKSLAAHDPYDSGVALRLMNALAAVGNRAGALQHAAVHERLLQEEFAVALPPEIVARVDELKQQPAIVATSDPALTYAHVSVLEPAPAPAPAPARPPLRTEAPRVSRAVAVLVTLFVVVFVAVWGIRHAADDPSAPAGARGAPAIAVLPFENVGNADDEYFAAGMTDEITSRLGAVRGLGVVPSRATERYARTDKTMREIGRELGVDYVLLGSVRWAGEDPSHRRVRIITELLRASDERQLWTDTYDRIIDDIFNVQSDIATQVIKRLGLTLGEGEQRQVSATPAENHEAYALYLKGRYFWNKRSENRAQLAYDYFQRAVELDPGYARAWVGIADVWIFRGWYGLLAPRETFPKAKQAARRAMQFDSTLAEAHASMAHIHFEFDHDFPAAEREYLRAIQLDPSYAIAHHWYGGFLSGMGRHAEALQHARTAGTLDPTSPIIQTWIGLRYYFAGEYDEAIAEYGKALELDRDFAPAHWHLGWAYEQSGRIDEGVAEAERALALDPKSLLYLASVAHAHAKAGRTGAARAELARLIEASKARYVSAYHVAAIYLALGETDTALDWLDRAYDEQSPWIGYLAVDPRVAALRGNPRFERLVQKARVIAARTVCCVPLIRSQIRGEPI
jgi:DNA-binding SARP family transcriptional activator/TolB-like protein/Tfp pilus assembly protein PilF